MFHLLTLATITYLVSSSSTLPHQILPFPFPFSNLIKNPIPHLESHTYIHLHPPQTHTYPYSTNQTPQHPNETIPFRNTTYSLLPPTSYPRSSEYILYKPLALTRPHAYLRLKSEILMLELYFAAGCLDNRFIQDIYRLEGSNSLGWDTRIDIGVQAGDEELEYIIDCIYIVAGCSEK